MIKIVETLVEKLNIVYTFRTKGRDKEKYKIIFNQWKRQGQRRRKKVKVYFIAVQTFVRLSQTWHTQQTCWWLETILLILQTKEKLITIFAVNNNNSFEEFDILIEVLPDAIYFFLIIKGGHKTKLTLSKQTLTPFIWNSEGLFLFLMI